ncbi:MAG: putative integral rane protein [Acidobacteriaceae bacterium]|nr:putative integral rane protein [Acidobacteriaceae bacterium]
MSATPAVAPERPSPYRFFIEPVLFFSYVIFGLSWIGYAPFLSEFQSKFGLNHAQSSLLISVVSFSKIFMPFIAGWMASWMGISRAISLGLILICASLFTPFAGSFAAILTSRFFFGLGGAILVTLIGPVVMQWFPRRELPVVNGFNYVAVNTGITASLFLTIPLAARIGQRETLIAYAIASIALAVAWIIGGRERDDPQKSSSHAGQESYLSVLKGKETWCLALGFSGPLALYLCLNTWLPTFYSESLGMTKLDGSRLTGLFNLAGIPAAILGGFLCKVFTRRKPLIWAPAIFMTLSAFGLFLLRDRTLLFACAAFFGASLFLWISPLSTLAMELPGTTPKRLAMVLGVYFSVSYSAAFFAPVLAGALRDRTGSFIPGFAIMAVASCSLAIFSAFLPETGSVSARA